MSDLEFHLQGPQTDATAAELETFFAETLGATARRETLPPPAGGTGEKADPIAVATLIVCIPGALLATIDLAERPQIKEYVARLIALARRVWTERGTRIWGRCWSGTAAFPSAPISASWRSSRYTASMTAMNRSARTQGSGESALWPRTDPECSSQISYTDFREGKWVLALSAFALFSRRGR